MKRIATLFVLTACLVSASICAAAPSFGPGERTLNTEERARQNGFESSHQEAVQASKAEQIRKAIAADRHPDGVSWQRYYDGNVRFAFAHCGVNYAVSYAPGTNLQPGGLTVWNWIGDDVSRAEVYYDWNCQGHLSWAQPSGSRQTITDGIGARRWRPWRKKYEAVLDIIITHLQ